MSAYIIETLIKILILVAVFFGFRRLCHLY